MIPLSAFPPADQERIAKLLDADLPAGEGIAAGPLLDERAVCVVLKLQGKVAGWILACVDDPDHARDFAHRLGELLALSVTRNRQADADTAALLRKVGRAN